MEGETSGTSELQNAPTRVVHLSGVFGGLGGVENILQDHYARDSQYGLDSKFIVLFEPPTPGWPRVHFLNWNFDLQIRKARNRLRSALLDLSPFDICVLHTEFGWPTFLDLLGDVRRISYIHSDIPKLKDWLPSRSRAVDGAIVVSVGLARRFLDCHPDFPPDRLLRSRYPIDPPPTVSALRKPGDGAHSWTLGFCGRICAEQKRLDRFPELVAQLATLGARVRYEFLGDGDLRSRLETQFPDRNRFVFHGRKPRAEIWNYFAQWDLILFTSDYEGTPIALLEAMAAGTLPIHPKIGSGGDDYAAAISPNLVYPAGDMQAMAQSISWLIQQPAEQLAEFRARAMALAQPHHGEIARAEIARFVKRIAASEPLRKTPMQKGPPFMDLLTFKQTLPVLKWTRRFRK
jgi:glycosyltransferase involved in cell wall biosynthesis